MEHSWVAERRNNEVYRYWKEKYGLVSRHYGMKVLGVGRDKFRALMKEYDISCEEMKAPANNWSTKLYKLSDIYSLKEELENKHEITQGGS